MVARWHLSSISSQLLTYRAYIKHGPFLQSDAQLLICLSSIIAKTRIRDLSNFATSKMTLLKSAWLSANEPAGYRPGELAGKNANTQRNSRYGIKLLKCTLSANCKDGTIRAIVAFSQSGGGEFLVGEVVNCEQFRGFLFSPLSASYQLKNN